MNIEFVRTLRTPNSERYILTKNAHQDVGAMDIHYRPDGTAAGTLIFFEEANIPDSEVPGILKWIDEVLFPDISIGEKNLMFTVVRGKVVGTFLPTKQDNPE